MLTARALTFRQLELVVLPLFARHRPETSRQPKIADLELAIRIDQEVARFEISVYDVSGVDVLCVSCVDGEANVPLTFIPRRSWYKKY